MQKYVRQLALLVAMPTLLACSFSNKVYEHSIRYNEAVGKAHDELMLLNILRAKDRLPLHFTAISQVKGSLSTTLGSGSEASFGGDAASLYKATPNANFESNPVFDVSVLNSDTFMKGILKPVSLETVQYYLDQGWPIDILFYILVEKIVFPEPPLATFNSFDGWESEELRAAIRAQKAFYLNAGDYEASEEEIRNNIIRAQSFRLLAKWLADNRNLVSIEHDPDNFGPPLTATSLNELVNIANSKRDLGLSESCSTDKDQCQLKTSQLILSIKNPQDEYLLFTSGPKPTGENLKQTNKELGSLILRSPYSIIYFLGELARDTTKDLNKATTLPGGEKLFVVKRENGAKERSYVEVKFDDEIYFIPHNREFYAEDPASPAGRSMQSIALLSQLLSLQQSASDLPKTQSVTIVGN